MSILMNRGIPEVIDLFSGCGGMALGFQSVGFKISHGLDLMQEAVETASYNLNWRYGIESGHICGDITQEDESLFINSIGPSGCIVIGGPPCQAYSLAGRAKLRSLGENRESINDKRGYLYQDFLRFALGLNARAVIMENVPEATNYGGKNIPQLVCEILKHYGYQTFWTVLNAADYGVPQIRERVFVIAIRNDENTRICLPTPLYNNPENKKTSIEMRFKSFMEYPDFIMPCPHMPNLPEWVTVGMAISDLPELFSSSDAKYVLNRINMSLPYRTDAKSEYQELMRTWFGSETSDVTGNCFRNTQRDFRIFEKMLPGDDYSHASEIADKLMEEECIARKITESSDRDAYKKLKKRIVPPYDRSSFVDKWHKLDMNKPAHTLVAHLSNDTYSHIHPYEPRGISVREAARLQSFPDDFLFQCSMSNAFKLIGNAVPPLLAKAIAKCVYNAFEER